MEIHSFIFHEQRAIPRLALADCPKFCYCWRDTRLVYRIINFNCDAKDADGPTATATRNTTPLGSANFARWRLDVQNPISYLSLSLVSANLEFNALHKFPQLSK